MNRMRTTVVLICILVCGAQESAGAQVSVQSFQGSLDANVRASVFRSPSLSQYSSLLGVAQRSSTVAKVRDSIALMLAQTSQTRPVVATVESSVPLTMECPMPVVRAAPGTGTLMPMVWPDSTIVRAIAGTIGGCTNPLDHK